MVKIKVLPKAKAKLQYQIGYAKEEFGNIAMKRWKEELDKIYSRLIRFPLSYAREKWLADYLLPYRSCIIRENFKLIYRYDSVCDLVVIVDLWDMRMNPKSILRQFRKPYIQ